MEVGLALVLVLERFLGANWVQNAPSLHRRQLSAIVSCGGCNGLMLISRVYVSSCVGAFSGRRRLR